MFDIDGNIVSKQVAWSRTRWSYDTLGFPTRELSKGDVYRNYTIEYGSHSPYELVQHWQEINTPTWQYDKIQLSPKDTFSVIFTLNRQGFPLMERNLKRGTSTRYEYADDNRLLRKLTTGMNDKDVIEEWQYRHNDQRLSQIRYLLQGHLQLEHFFSSEGLIDSTIYDTGEVAIYAFEYIE